MGSNGGWRGAAGRGRLTLLAALIVCMAVSATAHAVTPLSTIVEDVPGSTAHRYGTKDHLGNPMHTLKIVQSPFGGYLGVYHTGSGNRFAVMVATSVDLLHWRYAATLAMNASQPTIYTLRAGSALVAYENHAGCLGGKRCLTLRYYPSQSALLNGVATRTAVLPRTLSTCAEGTPNIFSATRTLSEVDVGFHYATNSCQIDRQARGKLSNFDPTTWAPWATPSIDQNVIAAGAAPDGKIGDRDGGIYGNSYHRLVEGQLIGGAFDSWRNFLLNGGSATQLAIRTHGGSQAFANPTFTPLSLPNGKPGVVVTQFIPTSGAAPGETGELVYYRPQDPGESPEIAAAGDIACAQNATCHDDDTSNLLVQDTPDKVLTLGDNQYEHGEIENFNRYYEPDWGRVKSITMPSPGNHDPYSSGYSTYFAGTPQNYSYQLGEWHLISLDSTNISLASSFLDSDLAANGWRRCILAYWHHPRFSSGATHGNNGAIGPLWTRLAAVGADVILAGHEHTYERFGPQTPTAVASETGIRQFIVGTGGKAAHSMGTVRANSEVRIAGMYGVLRMTLHPTSYEWRFQVEGGKTMDVGSDTCT